MLVSGALHDRRAKKLRVALTSPGHVNTTAVPDKDLRSLLAEKKELVYAGEDVCKGTSFGRESPPQEQSHTRCPQPQKTRVPQARVSTP